MGVFYDDVCRSDGLRWRDIHPKFYDDRLGNSRNIEVITATVCEAAMLVVVM
jgi:hypothetical protein